MKISYSMSFFAIDNITSIVTRLSDSDLFQIMGEWQSLETIAISSLRVLMTNRLNLFLNATFVADVQLTNIARLPLQLY